MHYRGFRMKKITKIFTALFAFAIFSSFVGCTKSEAKDSKEAGTETTVVETVVETPAEAEIVEEAPAEAEVVEIEE